MNPQELYRKRLENAQTKSIAVVIVMALLLWLLHWTGMLQGTAMTVIALVFVLYALLHIVHLIQVQRQAKQYPADGPVTADLLRSLYRTDLRLLYLQLAFTAAALLFALAVPFLGFKERPVSYPALAVILLREVQEILTVRRQTASLSE